MTKQEAIEAAQKYNREERERFEPRIEFVSMDPDGTWHGYDKEPTVDEDFDEWKFGSWKIQLDLPEEDWKQSKAEVE